MSTSKRLRVLAAVLALVVGALVACAPAGECMRFSDCATGQSCSSGLCSDATPDPGDGAAATSDDSATTSVGSSGDDASDAPAE